MEVALSTQLLTVAILSLQRQIYHNRGMNRTTWDPTYDFVIVGGGTAGSVLAGRLSENPNVKVLLLESGPPIQLTTEMLPTSFAFHYDWGYRTVRQQNAGFAFRNHSVVVNRGRILGGSHSINFAVYTRGNQHDYDSWANHYGAIGWDYRSVLPYFLRSQNQTDPKFVARNPRFHSTTGPLEVSTVPNPNPIQIRWNNALIQSGWPDGDLSDMENQYGTVIMQTTQSATNWTRQTTASAYVEANIGRPNLHVLVNSHVTRILFDNSGPKPKAIGVEFVRNQDMSQKFKVMASREVLLSAGSINTPQLMMLSGIGPRSHLEELGIPILLDLPGVGVGLQEHQVTIMDFEVTNSSDIINVDQYNGLNVRNLYQFLLHSRGPLTGEPIAQAYVATGINGDINWPDGIVYMVVSQYAPDFDTVFANNYYDPANREAWRTYLSQYLNNNKHFVLGFSQFRPLSRGTIRLASTNPLHAPLIDPQYFSEPKDLVSTVKIAITALKVMESPLMAPYVKNTQIPIPGCERWWCIDRPLSQCYKYLKCMIQTNSYTTFHPVGSCSMGNVTSTNACVDERLRVRGINSLRIIDASVMPSVPNCNTNAPTIMIAERASDLLKYDNGLM
ncbi:hypothetical protein BLOT_005362 [Blomia tropicalis]|nr:hypothetical protein BLOT_005362 [Blomia tropicalis]